jgi:hypothetical protein
MIVVTGVCILIQHDITIAIHPVIERWFMLLTLLFLPLTGLALFLMGKCHENNEKDLVYIMFDIYFFIIIFLLICVLSTGIASII